MVDNLKNLKAILRPEDYNDGPVKVYTKEEIDTFYETRYDDI